MDYGITLWGTTYKSLYNKIVIMQKKAIMIIAGAKYNEHTEPLFKELKVLKLDDLLELKLAKDMYSYTKGSIPTPLMDMFITNTDIHLHNTRNVNNPQIQSRITKIAQKSLRHMGPIIWYKIPNDIRESKIR